ncbi:MAG: FliA/WhiG family RNA polymerase sigma factor [Actinomycetota bacterium]
MREDIDVDGLWECYVSDRSKDDRDRLILHYSALVGFVASRLAAGLPSSVEQAELASSGMFGLIDAIEKFEPERGFKFETYAMSRIRGAILDELRSYDWVPRSVRAKARQLEQAFARFESEHHRAPSDEELADALGLDLDALQALMTQVSMTGVIALDELVGSDSDDATALVDVLPSKVDGPSDVLAVEELRHRMAREIDQLPEREKLVLALYYYEGLTLNEIGGVIGVTESRVCQIHTKAVMHLKSRLEASERDTSGAHRRSARS